MRPASLSRAQRLCLIALVSVACGGSTARVLPDRSSADGALGPTIDSGSGSEGTTADATAATDVSTEGVASLDATQSDASSSDADANDEAALSTLGDAALETGGDIVSDGAAEASASVPSWDGSFATLSEQCTIARDVFYVDSINHPSNDVIPNPTLTSTNLNTTWTARADALSFGAGAGTPIDTVGPANVTVTTVPGIPIVVGDTYAEPLNHSVPRPYLDLVVGDIDLTADGATSGSFRVSNLAEDADAGTVSSLAVSFDISVPFPNGVFEYAGCIRYQADPPVVPAPISATTDPAADAAAALFEPCANVGTGLYLENNGTDATILNADNASFGAGILNSVIEVDAHSGLLMWQLQATPNTNGPPAVGVYDVSSPTSGLVLLGPSQAEWCPGSSTGSYGITSLVTDPNDAYSVKRLSMWFDMQCASGGGALRGCVVLGQ